MTSLSADVANWSSVAYYSYGDTVFWKGQVYILNAVENSSPPYVPGVPPYPGDNVWWNPATAPFVSPPTGIPPPILPSAMSNFIQTGAGWDPVLGKGTISVSWSGGQPNEFFRFSTTQGGTDLSAVIDEDTQTATIYNVGTAPGFTINNVWLRAGGISGTTNLDISGGAMTTLGVPAAPTIRLVAYSIDPITSKGSVAITFEENSGVFNEANDFKGYAIGSTDRFGNPSYKFVYDRGTRTATFSEMTNLGGRLPPNSFKIFIQGSNAVGEGPISNILEENFNPQPPLPDDATNFAIVTFLTGGADYTSGWSINTSGNQTIGSWDCHTGVFTGTNPIPLFKQLQTDGVRVILSLGGATWNVAQGLSNGENLADNIAYSFFGVGSSPSGWARYGGATPFSFDGLDLDWEGLGPSNPQQAIDFVKYFRTNLPNALLSCAPQPTFSNDTNAVFHSSVFNANGDYQAFPAANSPVSDYVGRSGTPALLDGDHIGFFDYIFVQYYNQNPQWLPGGGGVFVENVGQWAKMCVSATPQTRDTPRVVFGFAATDLEITVPPNRYDGSQNGDIGRAITFTQNVLNTPDPTYFCAGCGFWNSPTANIPPPPESNPFTQIYNSDTGVPNLPAEIIMMYLNANGVNPRWDVLPILDFEEPGLTLPPLVYSLSNVAFGGNIQARGIQITFTTAPPPGLISLQVELAPTAAQVPPQTLSNYGAVDVFTSQPNNPLVYWLTQGITSAGQSAGDRGVPNPPNQPTWWNLNVRGLYDNGTTGNSYQQIQINSASGQIAAADLPVQSLVGGEINVLLRLASSSPQFELPPPFNQNINDAIIMWRDAGSNGDWTPHLINSIIPPTGRVSLVPGRVDFNIRFSAPIAGSFQYYVAYNFLNNPSRAGNLAYPSPALTWVP